MFIQTTELFIYINDQQPSITEMLKDMETVFTTFETDYYVVGAVARDIHLSAALDASAPRKTNDVDLAILIHDEGHFNQLKSCIGVASSQRSGE